MENNFEQTVKKTVRPMTILAHVLVETVLQKTWITLETKNPKYIEEEIEYLFEMIDAAAKALHKEFCKQLADHSRRRSYLNRNVPCTNGMDVENFWASLMLKREESDPLSKNQDDPIIYRMKADFSIGPEIYIDGKSFMIDRSFPATVISAINDKIQKCEKSPNPVKITDIIDIQDKDVVFPELNAASIMQRSEDNIEIEFHSRWTPWEEMKENFLHWKEVRKQQGKVP